MSSLDVRAIDKSELPERPRPAAAAELAVFFAEAAFDRMVERGHKDLTREIGGVLVGELVVDDRGPYLSIVDTIDALHADEKGAELTFTHATWDHIHKEMDSKHQGRKVVGWYHTHPGFGVFLSDRDQFIHKSFFNLPFQVAFVYDPKTREHGVFAWRDNETWRMRRYVIGAREHVWDGDRAVAKPDKGKLDKVEGKPERERSRDRDDDERRDDDRIGSLGSFAIAGLVLVLLAGFVGYWFGSSQAAAAVSRVQLEVIRARAEGANDAIAQLDNGLLTVLREALNDRGVEAQLDAAIVEIDGAMRAVAPTAADPGATGAGAAPSPAMERLVAIRARLFELQQERRMAHVLVAQMAEISRSHHALKLDVAKDVARQRNALGNAYLELAQQVGKADSKRVKRLLDAAVSLDPGNRAQYQRAMSEIDPKARLAMPTGGVPLGELVPLPAAPSTPTAPGAGDSTHDQAPGATAPGGTR